MLILHFLIFAITLSLAHFRPKPIFLEKAPKWSTKPEDYVIQPHRLKLMFERVPNNGFYVITTVKYSERKDVTLKSRTD